MEFSNQTIIWWDQQDKNDRAKAMFDHVIALKTRQTSGVTDRNLRHVRLYGNAEISGLKPYQYSNTLSDRTLTMNVVQSACDTATARIGKSKPRPQFLTFKGNYKMKKEAEKLQLYCDGVFEENKMYQLGQRVFKDATITGTGAVKFYPAKRLVKKGEYKTAICAERVFIDEIVVDEVQCMYDDPMEYYQIKIVPRRTLKALHPKKKAMIDKSKSDNDMTYLYQGLDQMTVVIEGWKLPSGPGAGDGLHILAVDSGELFSEEWVHDWEPFEFFRWNRKTFGFYGQGIAEMLTGIQYEINKLLKVIQLSMHLGSIPKIFMDANSKIVKQHLNNEIGGIITYQGMRPTYDQLMAIPPVLFTQLQTLYEKSFEIIGLSQMSVAGVKPAGLDSGKALRTFNNIETDRFAIVAQDYDQFMVNCSKKFILMSEFISEKDSSLKTTSFNNKEIENIAWKDIDIARDQYIQRVFPTNFLQTTPEGKIEDVKDLMSIGMLNKNQASSLMDYPDLDQFTQYNNAATDDIMAVMYDIIDEGVYNPPMPQQALQYGKELFQQVWLKMKHQKLEPERLEMLMRWVEDADMLMQMALPQPVIGDPNAQVQASQPGTPATMATTPGGQSLPPGQNTQSTPMPAKQ